ncbi:MAG: hypothetical protein J2P53_01480 [Bradyrhizobiaceae bacterium]|nr:hypothetical protein [Bradyrhizobiaceae bacterium]
MKRPTMPILFSLAILTGEAGMTGDARAQNMGIDTNSLRPSLRVPLPGDTTADTFKRLPYQDLGSEIHIRLAADALYDFASRRVRSSAADYFQQAANLIFEQARGPVRIECQSDRDPKLAEQCANAIAQWMTVEEKLTKVKFTTVGKRLPAAAAAPGNKDFLTSRPDPSPGADTRPSVTIVFTKK